MNKDFRLAFSKIFREEKDFHQIDGSDPVKMMKIYNMVKRNPTKFLRMVNIRDKQNIYRWMTRNSVQMANELKYEPQLRQEVSLTENLCKEIFQDKWETVWYNWNLANGDPEKFMNLVNIYTKLCLHFWSE